MTSEILVGRCRIERKQWWSVICRNWHKSKYHRIGIDLKLIVSINDKSRRTKTIDFKAGHSESQWRGGERGRAGDWPDRSLICPRFGCFGQCKRRRVRGNWSHRWTGQHLLVVASEVAVIVRSTSCCRWCWKWSLDWLEKGPEMRRK